MKIGKSVKRILRSHWKRWGVYLQLWVLICPSPSMAQGIQVDQSSTEAVMGCSQSQNCHATSIDRTEDGQTPIVNISRPNGQGLSHNRFHHYNVSPSGVLINNDTQMGISQVAGHRYMQNPNLDTRMAEKILFSVTGTGRSTLEGYSEIVGQEAHFILSNPNGIYVNGAGFINIPRATLSTGVISSSSSGGDLQAAITGGLIQIGLEGIDYTGVTYADILSRSLQMHGNIYNGDRVRIITGENQVQLNPTLSHQGLSSSQSRPLDSVLLGGIYANTIYINSTEAGVGVNSTGEFLAAQGGIELSSAGELSYKNAYAKDDITIRATGDLQADGTSYSELGGINIQADDVVMSGASTDQVSADTVAIDANSIQIDTVAVVASSVQLNADTQVTLEDTSLDASTIQLESSGEIVAVDAQFNSSSTLVIDAQGNLTLSNVSGVAEDIDVDAAILDAENTQIVSVGDQNINVEELESDNSEFTAGSDLTVNSQRIQQSSGAILHANGNLDISADEIVNDNSQLSAIGDVSLNAGTISNQNSALISAGNELSIQSDQLLNSHSTIHSDGALTINSRTLENVSTASISTNGSVTVATESFLNDNGQFNAANAIGLSSIQIRNQNSGTIAAGSDLTLTSDLIDNSSGGYISAVENVSVNADSFENDLAIITGQTMSLNLARLENTDAIIRAVGTLTVYATAIVNKGGEIWGDILSIQAQESTGGLGDTSSLTVINTSQNALIGGATQSTIVANTIRNANNASISSNGSSSLTASEVINDGAEITAGGDLTIQATTVENNDNGLISTARNLEIITQSFRNLQNSQVNAIQSLNLQANAIENDTSMINGQSVVLTSTSLSNDNGQLLFESGEAVGVRYGILGDNIVINADTITMDAGVAYAETSLVFNTVATTAGTLNLSNGAHLLSGDSTEINDYTLDLADSQIEMAGQLSITGPEMTMSNASIEAGSLVADFTGDIELSNGSDINVGVLNVSSNAWHIGSQSSVVSNGLLKLYASSVTNNGEIIGGAIRIGSDSIYNNGQILSNGILTVSRTGYDYSRGQVFNNDDGLLFANGDLWIGASLVKNLGHPDTQTGIHSGNGGNMYITGSDVLINNDIISDGGVQITATIGNETISGTGKITANTFAYIETLGSIQGLTVMADDLKLSASNLQVNKAHGVSSFEVINSADLILNATDEWSSGGNIDILNTRSFVNNGLIVAGQDLNLELQADGENFGTIFAGSDFNLTGYRFWNRATGLLYSLADFEVDIDGGFNNYGVLQSEGDMSLTAYNLANYAIGVDGDTEDLVSISATGPPSCGPGLAGCTPGASWQWFVRRFYFSPASSTARISSLQDLTINLDASLINRDSIIEAAGDLDIRARQVDNTASISRVDVLYPWNETRSDLTDYLSIVEEYSPGHDLLSIQIADYLGSSDYTIRSVGGTYLGESTTGYRWDVQSSLPSPYTARADQGSFIRSGGALSISASTINNTGTQSQGVSVSTTSQGRPTVTTIGQGAQLTPSMPSSSTFGPGALFQRSSQAPPSTTLSSISELPVRSGAPVAITEAEIGETVIHRHTPDLYARKENASENTYWYLYESRTSGASLDGFIGSDYFLERMGTNNKKVYQLLGDSLLERQIVMDSIRDTFHGGYTQDDINSVDEQMQFLYDNALENATELKLELGKELSIDQVSALKKDMIWLVEKEVDGVNVLVPTVYLSKLSMDNVQQQGTGATIVAKDLSLTAKNNIRNSGTIKGLNSSTITGGQVLNSGRITSGGTLLIESDGDIRNGGLGLIKGEGFTGLRSKSGGILNYAKGKDKGILSNSTVFLDSHKDIDITRGRVGGLEDLIVNSDGNIAMDSGSLIISRDNIIANAGKDIHVKSPIHSNVNLSLISRGTLKSQYGDKLSIRSNKSLVIDTGKSLDLNNARIGAEALSIRSKENINADSSILYAFGDRPKPSLEKGLSNPSSGSLETGSTLPVAKPSSLEQMVVMANSIKKDAISKRAQNGTVVMRSGKDTNLRATTVFGNDSFDIEAGGDVNIESKLKQSTQVKGNSWDNTITNQTRHNGSYLHAGKGNSRIKAAKDLSITASTISSQGNLMLDASEITIKNEVDTIKKERNYKQYVASAGGWQPLTYTLVNKKENSTDKLIAQSSIRTGGNLTLKSKEDTNITGSTVDAGTNLIADVGNLNINTGSTKLGTENDWELRNYGSRVTVGNTMAVKAKDSVRITGSKLDVKNAAIINAGNDIIVDAAMDETYKKTHHSSGGGLFRKKKSTTIENRDQSAVGSVIKVGSGGAVFKAGRDVTIEGSNLESEGSLALFAGRDATIKAAQENDYRQVTSSKKGWISKKSSTETIDQGVSRESKVKTNGNLIVKAGNDLNVIGSELIAEDNALIDAGNNVLITADKTHYNYDYKSKSRGLLSGGSTSKKSQKVNQFQTRIKVGGKEYTEGDGVTAKNELSGNLSIKSGNQTTIEGLIADTTGDLSVDAKNLHISSVVEESRSAETDTKDGVFTDKKSVDRNYNLNHKQTKLNVGGSLVLKSKEDTLIEGGEFNIKENLDIDAGGALVMKTTKDITETYHRKEVESFGGISFSTTRSSASLNLHTNKSTDEKFSRATTNTASKFRVGGNVRTRSGKDTVMVSTDMLAVGHIDQESKNGSVLSLAAKDTYMDESTHEKAEITNSLTIGNSWVEAGYRAKEAVDGIKSAGNQNLNSRNGKINAMAKTLSATVAAAQVARTVESAANSAQDAGSLGFNLSHQHKVSTTATAEKNIGDRTVAGLIRSLKGNIRLVGKEKVHIEGSDVIADEGDIYASAKEVNLQGVYDENTMTSSLSHDEVSTSVGTNGPDLPTYTKEQQDSSIAHRNVRHTTIKAGGTLKIDAKRLNVVGGIAQAKNVDLTGITDKIHVESLLDDVTERTGGNSISVGNRMGYSVNETTQDSQYLSHRSGIYAENDLKIDVDHLSLKGGVIAGVNEHNGQAANLQIKARKLSTEDLIAKDQRFSERVGTGYQGITAGGLNTAGSTLSASASNNGHEKETLYQSIIGQGTLQISTSDVPKNLVRDVTKGEIVVKDETLGGLEADATVATRWIAGGETLRASTKGVKDPYGKPTMEVDQTSAWEEITKDLGKVADLPKNSMQGLRNTKYAVGNLTQSTSDFITGQSRDGLIEDYKSRTRNEELALQLKVDHNIKNALNNLGNDPEVAEKSLEVLAQRAMGSNGGGSEIQIQLYNAKDGRMGGHKDGKIYINMAYQQNTQTLMETLGDELSHYYDYKKGLSFNKRRQEISRSYGNEAGEKILRSLGESAKEEIPLSAIDSYDFNSANLEVSRLEGIEARTYFANGINNNKFNGMDENGVRKPADYAIEFSNNVNAVLSRKEVIPVPGIFTSGGTGTGLVEVLNELVNNSQYSDQVSSFIKEDLVNNPLGPGEKVNLIGYSGGGPVMFNVADELDGMQKIDNLITIGSPAFELTRRNINSVTRVNSQIDFLSAPGRVDFRANRITYPDVTHNGKGYYLSDPKVIKDIADIVR